MTESSNGQELIDKRILNVSNNSSIAISLGLRTLRNSIIKNVVYFHDQPSIGVGIKGRTTFVRFSLVREEECGRIFASASVMCELKDGYNIDVGRQLSRVPCASIGICCYHEHE